MKNRKEEIIMATLELASEKGLGAVSMNMIAEKIGIKKPSLYNHFKSKEELVSEMYLYLRERAQKETKTQMNFEIFKSKSAQENLSYLVKNYIALSLEPKMQMFYKVIYSERAISREAAKIMTTETEKMINATKQVLSIMSSNKLLQFNDIETSSMSFALTIHSLMDYSLDKYLGYGMDSPIDMDLIDGYISNFCYEHEVKE